MGSRIPHGNENSMFHLWSIIYLPLLLPFKKILITRYILGPSLNCFLISSLNDPNICKDQYIFQDFLGCLTTLRLFYENVRVMRHSVGRLDI